MAKAEHTVVGTSPARMGGVERVIGAGIYGIDFALKDELHGGILRSQYAHAKIVSIDTSEAKKIPGVHAVVTATDAPDLHDDMPLPKNLPADVKVKNVCSYTAVHVGDPDKAMVEADVVVDEVYETKMIHPQYLEPRIAAAQVEPDGRITVWANAQAPFPVRTDVAKLLGVPLNRVRVLATELGGGFGGKASGITSGAAVEPICALLAVGDKRAATIGPPQ